MTARLKPKILLASEHIVWRHRHHVNQPVSRSRDARSVIAPALFFTCSGASSPLDAHKTMCCIAGCYSAELNPDHCQPIGTREKNRPLTHACTGISRGARRASARLGVHTIEERHGSIWRRLINSREFISFHISAASGALCRRAHWARSSRLPC